MATEGSRTSGGSFGLDIQLNGNAAKTAFEWKPSGQKNKMGCPF